MPPLTIDQINILDRKCNNKWLSKVFNQKTFCNFNSNTRKDLEISFKNKPFTFYLSYPLTPKMKETHFKIISGIYPVTHFLQKRFKMNTDELCVFCSTEKETIEHLFFCCPHVADFWTAIHSWISLKIQNVPSFTLKDVIYFMDNLDLIISDAVNFVIVMGKYFIHTCKWKNTTPIFTVFNNYFVDYFRSLKCIFNLGKKALRVVEAVKKSLLF